MKDLVTFDINYKLEMYKDFLSKRKMHPPIFNRVRKEIFLHLFLFLIRILATPSQRWDSRNIIPAADSGPLTVTFSKFHSSLCTVGMQQYLLALLATSSIPDVRGFFLKEFDIEFFALLGPRWWRTRRRKR